MMAIRIGMTIVAFAMLAGAPAEGASFDCKRAATAHERAICADAKLSALDDELARQYSEALSLSLDPAETRSDQSRWLRRVRDLGKPEEIATAYTARLQTLGIVLAPLREIAAKREVRESDVRAGCLAAFAEPIVDAPCRIEKFGELGTLDGHSFVYALYGFATAGGAPMGARVLIFERLDADRLRILLVPENDGGPFEPPQLLRTRAGVLLHIPGHESATGNFNRERLFIWRQRQWRDVDTNSWLDTLQRRLPNGLNAMKGIYPDYASLTASTPLWRDGAGNASPAAGSAAVQLGWRGDRIVLKSVAVRRR